MVKNLCYSANRISGLDHIGTQRRNTMAFTNNKIPAFINQRRWWWLLLGAWAAAIFLSWQSQSRDIEHTSIQVAAEGARNMFRMVVVTRNWNASHGGVYVPITPATQPNPYLQHPLRDVMTTDGLALTLVNPAYMTRLIGEIAKIDTGAIFRLTSLKPIRPENAPDTWERKALLAFEGGTQESIEVESSIDGPLLRYMAPLRVEKPCLQCHASQGYREGDIRGGVSVSQRYAPIQMANQASVRQTALLHTGVFMLMAALGWLLLELLRKRWLELVLKMQELETTRDELVQSEKMASLGRMVAGFAHEINTPVGVAVGAISQHADILAHIDTLMTQEEVSETELRAELEHLRQGGALALSNLRRAAHLVQSLKRTSVDQSSEQVRSFGMKELIQDVCATLQHSLKRLPVTTHIDCAEELLIKGVPGLLEQLLTNLIMNALQHAFDDGTRPGNIRIAALRQGDAVQLHFSDDGVGMTEDQVSRIFEPFYTTRRAQGGSGLGLYICYNIVTTKLGGSIECVSSPNAGCCFHIQFPEPSQPSPQEAHA